MSRLGKNPILVPKGVNVVFGDKSVEISCGEKNVSVPFDFSKLSADFIDGFIHVSPSSEFDIKDKFIWGTTRANLNNAILGIVKPFEVELKIQGVGYKSSIVDNFLILSLGYSHDILYEIPTDLDISIKCVRNIITIFGKTKSLVHDIAERICNFRKYDPYKGKGVISDHPKYKIKKSANKK
ncbi:50S ribosomal protein L6 [Anaplasmataceae bacterium AB001_6]|nr:50S ribosomal protein L6 [Anaplasmataceae bacterium AB001_6]